MAEEQEREILRESNLARKICKGEGEQFHNERYWSTLTRSRGSARS